MSEDPIALLVEGLVAERKAREARLQGLVDRILGRPEPVVPPAPPVVPPPAVPEPPSPEPNPPLPAAAIEPDPPPPDRTAALHEALGALKAEKDELLRKNMALYDELQRAQAPSGPAGAESAVRVGRLEALLRERDEMLKAERQSTDQGKAALAASRAALSAAEAGLAAREEALAGLRTELATQRQAVAEARREAEVARSQEPPQAPGLEERLQEALEARSRLEVALRSAGVQATVLEETLRQREQALAAERQRAERLRCDLQDAQATGAEASRQTEARLAALQSRTADAERAAAAAQDRAEALERAGKDQAARIAALEEVLRRRQEDPRPAPPVDVDQALLEVARGIRASRSGWLDAVIAELAPPRRP